MYCVYYTIYLQRLQGDYFLRLLYGNFALKKDEEMDIKKKKELAKLIFLSEPNVTQQEIADRTGASRVSIGKWVKEWEKLKLNLLQTREERINSTLIQLDELDRAIAQKPEGARFPDKNEAQIRRKLTEDLEALEQDASIRDIYNVSRRLLDWLRPRNLEKAKELANYFDAYIKEQMKWAK